MKEKIKPIVLTDTDNGDVFTLEFNRESVKFAEMRGFDIEDVAKYPMTKIPELFFYAFRMHHKNLSREKIDKILIDDLGGLNNKMVERLSQLYIAPFECLVQDEDEIKNSKMTVEM